MKLKVWTSLMSRWSRLVFRERYSEITPKIRALRVLEESMELAQAEDVTEDEVNQVRKQVFSKPKGEPKQELGGILVCLAGYSATSGHDLDPCFWAEFERIMDPAIMEKVRQRNLEGDKIGFVRKKPLLILGQEEGVRLTIEDIIKDVGPLSTEINSTPHQKISHGLDITKPHGFDLMGHDWDPSDNKPVIKTGDWIPIDQFKNATHGFTAEVLVDNQLVEGYYETGRTYGWTDEDGKWIHPTHFRLSPKSITGFTPFPENISLKVGHHYQSRRGDTIAICNAIQPSSDAYKSGFRFTDYFGTMYKANGRYREVDGAHENDLILDITPEDIRTKYHNLENKDK